VNNGGVLAPGNSIGTITVNGNWCSARAASTASSSRRPSSDRTNVTGSATLGGTAQTGVRPGTYTQHSYTILSAAGGRSGTLTM
jgi:hypothetical protein